MFFEDRNIHTLIKSYAISLEQQKIKEIDEDVEALYIFYYETCNCNFDDWVVDWVSDLSYPDETLKVFFQKWGLHAEDDWEFYREYDWHIDHKRPALLTLFKMTNINEEEYEFLITNRNDRGRDSSANWYLVVCDKLTNEYSMIQVTIRDECGSCDGNIRIDDPYIRFTASTLLDLFIQISTDLLGEAIWANLISKK